MVQAEEDIAGIQNLLSSDVAVQNMKPLGIAAGGSGHAFSTKDYKVFFGDAENRGPLKYLEAKINMLWIGARSAGMTGVPWREESIVDMAEHGALFQHDRYTEIMYINVGRDPLKVDVPSGGLSRVSPPELHFAYLKRVHKKLKNEGERVCESIRHGILDVTARFVALDNEEAWWFEYNLRDKADHLKQKVGQTLFQRICGFSSLKRARVEAAGASAVEPDVLSKYMQSKATYVDGKDIDKDDATSPVFVKSAEKVIQVMQDYSAVRRCLTALDRENGFNNPLNSIHKLMCCIKAADGQDQLTWLFEALLDGTRSKVKTVVDASLNNFRSAKGGNLPGIIVRKLDFKNYLIRKATGMLSVDFTTTLNDVFQSYRQRWMHENNVMPPP